MKKLPLGYTDPSQFDGLTEAERGAWNHPEAHSYHSFHVERMGADTFRWRDSRSAHFYIGTANELLSALYDLQLRKPDPNYQNHVQTLRILSQAEVDDLLTGL